MTEAQEKEWLLVKAYIGLKNAIGESDPELEEPEASTTGIQRRYGWFKRNCANSCAGILLRKTTCSV